jgi:hypothetical protein
MTQEEIAAAFTRIFGGLHPTPQDAFRAGVVVGIASGVMHVTPLPADVKAAPETQSPPEGGEGLADQKATWKGCPCKQSDCATLREALQRIADMDPKGLRADDLGRAARTAREALSAHGVDSGDGRKS